MNYCICWLLFHVFNHYYGAKGGAHPPPFILYHSPGCITVVVVIFIYNNGALFVEGLFYQNAKMIRHGFLKHTGHLPLLMTSMGSSPLLKSADQQIIVTIHMHGFILVFHF